MDLVDFIIQYCCAGAVFQHPTQYLDYVAFLYLSYHLNLFHNRLFFPEMTPNGASATSHDPGPPFIEHDIDLASDRYLLKLKSYARALPYSIESNSKIQALLDFICMRIVQAVQARDYDPGFLQWDSMLT